MSSDSNLATLRHLYHGRTFNMADLPAPPSKCSFCKVADAVWISRTGHAFCRGCIDETPPPIYSDEVGDLAGPYLDPIDLEALMTGDPPTEEWCIEPLIPARKHVGIVASRGVGKSLLALDLAARKAAGVGVLGTGAGPPTSVAYFDFEMGPEDLFERLTDLGWTPDRSEWPVLVANLHYFQLIDLPPLDTPEGGAELENLIERYRVKVVVIDTLSKVVAGKENENDTFTALWRHTESRLRRRKVTLIRLDHFGKDVTRGSRGGSTKEDTLDVVWELTSAEDILTLKMTKSRQGWLDKVVRIHRVHHNGTLGHEVAEQKMSTEDRDLLDLIDKLGLFVDATLSEVQRKLQDSGNGRRRSDIARVLRFRKALPGRSGTVDSIVPGTETGTTGNQPPETASDQGISDGNHDRNPRNLPVPGFPPPKGGNRTAKREPRPGPIETAEQNLAQAGLISDAERT